MGLMHKLKTVLNVFLNRLGCFAHLQIMAALFDQFESGLLRQRRRHLGGRGSAQDPWIQVSADHDDLLDVVDISGGHFSGLVFVQNPDAATLRQDHDGCVAGNGKKMDGPL